MGGPGWIVGAALSSHVPWVVPLTCLQVSVSPALNKKDPRRMKHTIRVFNCGSGRLSGVPSVPFISEKLRMNLATPRMIIMKGGLG